MIFTSFDALANRIGSDMVVSPFAAIMCDGDVRKPIRMRQYAREALEALDRLDAECDKRYCKEQTDLALDINCAYADVYDILDRLEALE